MKKFLFITAILLSLNSGIANASHAMGGDLTYRCLGPGTTPGTFDYELTFSFYRDCLGSVIPIIPLPIDITNGCGLTIPTLALPLISITQITPICPTGVTTCDGGPENGVEKYLFRGTVTLPGECIDWTFSHSEGVRNAAITTVSNPTGYNLFVYCVINNLGGLCNNSPVFSNSPVPYACNGQQFCYNNGAFDVEGDSLVFDIIHPRFGPSPGDTVQYISGYSATQPVQSNTPMVFSHANGDFCIWPTQQDVTILAILVSEFRNGIMIGQTERDIQMNVQSCTNNLPILPGLNGTPHFSSSVCVNQQNCFFFRSIDVDTANNTLIGWDNSIPGATFTNTHGHRDTAFFCWTPTLADTSSSPYCFTVSVFDDNCPYMGVQIYTYCLTVDASASCHTVFTEPVKDEMFDLKIFPQPTNEILYIDFGNNFNSFLKYNLRIDNILGQNIYQSKINDQITSIDIRLWISGIHFVYLIDENGRKVGGKKIIISR